MFKGSFGTIKNYIWADNSASTKHADLSHSPGTEFMSHNTAPTPPSNSTSTPKEEGHDTVKPPQPVAADTTIHGTGPHVERVSNAQPTTSESRFTARERKNSALRLPNSGDRKADPAGGRKRHRDTEDQLLGELATKKTENNHLLENLSRIRDERNRAVGENRTFRTKIDELRTTNIALISQLQELKKESDVKEQAMRQKIAELEAINKRKDDELRITKTKLHATEESKLQMTQLLDARTADLNGVQPFLTMADSYSGVDIITMTESLNAEIFQTAAHMAEMVEDESMVAKSDERASYVEHYRKSLDYARREIGEALWVHCEKHRNEMRVDPLPLQLTMQCILSRWCAYNVRSFEAGDFGTHLDELYKRIRESEVQPIAGRWRAITSANIAPSSTENTTNNVVRIVLGLLFFCGWSPTSDARWQKSTASCLKMVSAIEKIVVQLRKATKQGITTADMEVFVIPSEDAFQSNQMEDIYAEDVGINNIGLKSEKSGERVLCTVGLGVRRSLLKRNEDKTLTEAREVLLRPKVALTSVLLSDQGSNNRASMIHLSGTDGKDWKASRG